MTEKEIDLSAFDAAAFHRASAERVIRTHAVEVRRRMILELEHPDRWDAIVELAVERATSIGAAEYGDASFRKSIAELVRERIEEHADAVFYGAVEVELETIALG